MDGCMGTYLVCILHRCRAVGESAIAENAAPRLVKEEMNKGRGGLVTPGG